MQPCWCSVSAGPGMPPGGPNGVALLPQVIESLGIMIYKALDYGLKENEERELSPPLEHLIDLMTNVAEGDICPDEGYEAAVDEEDSANVRRVHGYRDVLKVGIAELCL